MKTDVTGGDKLWEIAFVFYTVAALARGQEPIIISHPSIYAYGDTVTLRCIIFGGVGPFTFNDWEVPTGSTSLTRGIVTTTDVESTLMFTAYEEDSGEYGCQIQENSGPDTTTVTVVPAILNGPMDMTLEYSDGLTATFTCTAFGGDGALLDFAWSGFNIASQSETLNRNNSTTSTITTITLTLDDRGSQYSCDVEYQGGSTANEETATLNIVPAVVEEPENVLVGLQPGGNISFSCTAYGGPLGSLSLHFTWSGPMGANISNVETEEAVNGTVISVLTLVNVTVEYEGNYNCSAAYSDMPQLVSTSQIATLGGIGTPEQPQNLVLLNITSHSIVLKWNGPYYNNTGEIITYEIKYVPKETFDGQISTSTVNTSNGSVLMMVVTGLEEYVQYNISVRAYTIVGPGPYSHPVSVRTDTNEPDAPPQNVMSVVLSSTEIRVCWEEVPAINQNGKITMYEVQYDPFETFSGVLSTETVNITDTSMQCTVLTGLEEYVQYNIRVRAYTNTGPGPYSGNISNMTETDKPDNSPQNVMVTAVSSTGIRVSWEKIPAINQNGEITSYEIKYVPLDIFDGQISTNTVNTSDGSVLMMTLTGLDECVEYTISVRAYTSAGPGPYSDPVSERSLEGDKLSVLVSATTATSISLSWKTPCSSVVTSYEVMWQRDTSGDCPEEDKDSTIITNTSTTYEIMGLEEDSSYRITVAAANTDDSSGVSETITAVTLEDAPSAAPTSVSASIVTSSSITVQWGAVDCIYHNGDITGYLVRYGVQGSADRNRSVEMAAGNSSGGIYTISKLTASAIYTVEVAAVNSAGSGEYSAPLTFLTPAVSTGSDNSQINIAAIIGGVVAVVLILSITVALAIIVKMILRHRGDYSMKRDAVNAVDIPSNEAHELSRFSEEGTRRDHDNIPTFTNEVYQVMKESHETDTDFYETIATLPPSIHHSSHPATEDSIYEPV